MLWDYCLGFMFHQKYKILNFCVLPISINNKIYYILHPDHLSENIKSYILQTYLVQINTIYQTIYSFKQLG